MLTPLKPTMYHQFNIQQVYVLPTQTVFMCFVWISEQTAIISLYSINWLVFVTDTERVYCAVRTLYIFPTELRAMAQANIGRLLTVETTFDPRPVLVIFVVYKVALIQVSLAGHRCSPLSIIPPTIRTDLHLYVALNRRTNGWSLGPSRKKSKAVSKS